MKSIRLALSTVLLASVVIAQASAEDLNVIFKKVNDYVAAQNYSKALEELKWASKEIEKMNSKKIETFFPDSVAGFTGDKIQSNSVMGISNIERNYKGPDGVNVKVSLTNMGGGAGNPLGGFAQMAAMMGGGATGTDTFRIQGRTATLETPEGSNSADLTVVLESGSILKLEQSGSNKAETVKAIAEGLKLEDLDKYLKGVA